MCVCVCVCVRACVCACVCVHVCVIIFMKKYIFSEEISSDVSKFIINNKVSFENTLNMIIKIND